MNKLISKFLDSTMTVAELTSEGFKQEIRDLLKKAQNGTLKVTEVISTIWKTISVGGKTKDQLIAFVEKSFRISDYAKSMMNHKNFKTSTETKEVSFVVKTVREFGFSEPPKFKDFINFFRNHKEYMLCEAEDGPTLRVAYDNQPKGEWIRLVMDTIPDSLGAPSVFRLNHDDDSVWLSRDWFSDDSKLYLDVPWLVRLRK